MRSYFGERDPLGRPTVWVLEEAASPEVAEISELLADLPPVGDPRRAAVDWPERRAEWLLRKHDLLARIDAANYPERRLLHHTEVHTPDGFEWGVAGDGAAELAHAILGDHLGVEPTDAVCHAFRDQVIVSLPAERFRIPSSLVGAWVGANRELLDRELFLNPPDVGGEPAWSVTDQHPSADPTGGPDGDLATASTLVAACEIAWRDIQTHHPELPDAVIVLGTGVERGRLVKLGHWWGGQWMADGETRGEVLLAGEALHLQPAQVFEVLLHEAAHGINAARGIKDTSRGGRYHNQRFAATAREVLLRVRAMPPHGLARTDLTPEAVDRYGRTIERLGNSMRIARQLRAGHQVGDEGGKVDGKDGGVGTDEGRARGGATAAACGCGRKVRMAPSTLAAGPVVCGLCGSEFTNGAQRSTTPEPDRHETQATQPDAPADTVVDRSFLDRRDAALTAATVAPADPPSGADEIRAESRTGADPETLARWYERRGAIDDTPMPAATTAEAARRDRLARALLQADGTLHGPTVDARAGVELQAGDRVRAAADHDDLPVGTLGTVERVDHTGGTVEVDFATWGRLRASLTDAITTHLRHDYTEITGPPLDVPEVEL